MGGRLLYRIYEVRQVEASQRGTYDAYIQYLKILQVSLALLGKVQYPGWTKVTME